MQDFEGTNIHSTFGINKMVKIGRNQHCPCGSGKKYKKCCLATHESNQIMQSQMQLAQKWQADDRVTMLDDPGSDSMKLSEIILEFADELLSSTDTFQQQEQVIGFAMLAWNLAFSPEEKQAKEISRFLRMANIQDADAIQYVADLVMELIHKKQIEYPFIHRQVIDYDFIATREGGYLNVISTIHLD